MSQPCARRRRRAWCVHLAPVRASSSSTTTARAATSASPSVLPARSKWCRRTCTVTCAASAVAAARNVSSVTRRERTAALRFVPMAARGCVDLGQGPPRPTGEDGARRHRTPAATHDQPLGRRHRHVRHRRACRSQEPVAGAAGLDAKRERAGAGALHVGPHVLRLVDPARQGRDVERDALLRGLLHPRPVVSLDRLDRRRRRDLAARRARDARAAQVPDRLPPVPRVPRPRQAR